MPSGPPGYSQVASQGRTDSNTGQGWSMPSAPPNYSDLTNGGSGMGPPPMAPNMVNPSDNPDLPPPSYEDAMKNTGKVTDPRIFYCIYILKQAHLLKKCNQIVFICIFQMLRVTLRPNERSRNQFPNYTKVQILT